MGVDFTLPQLCRKNVKTGNFTNSEGGKLGPSTLFSSVCLLLFSLAIGKLGWILRLVVMVNQFKYCAFTKKYGINMNILNLDNNDVPNSLPRNIRVLIVSSFTAGGKLFVTNLCHLLKIQQNDSYYFSSSSLPPSFLSPLPRDLIQDLHMKLHPQPFLKTFTRGL